MKLDKSLWVYLFFALTISFTKAENRRRSRHYLSRSRSYEPDIFDKQVLAVRGPNEIPTRSIRMPYPESRFEKSKSQQEFSMDASPAMRTWPNTAEVGRDYDVRVHEMNWERIQASQDQRSDAMGGSGFPGSATTFKPNVPDNSIWSYLPLIQSQRENSFISQQETRMWPDVKFESKIMCRCGMNLGRIYGFDAVKPNEIQAQTIPLNQRHAPESSAYDQRPQTHHQLGLPSIPYPIRTTPSANPRGNHYPSRPNKHPIRPELTTANPNLLRYQPKEATTKRQSQSDVMKYVLA